MFQNKRYLTIGIKNAVSIEIQMLIWQMIDNRVDNGEKLDYLQVFELYEKIDGQGIKRQEIIHRQEQPEYEQVYYVSALEFCTCKIYVIDDETHSTMLLAEEY